MKGRAARTLRERRRRELMALAETHAEGLTQDGSSYAVSWDPVAAGPIIDVAWLDPDGQCDRWSVRADGSIRPW